MKKKILALTGGVGGAKLLSGMQQCLGADELVSVVNTGDDFVHLGLRICPDLDSLMYFLAGENNLQTGWGRRDETWNCLDALQQYGESAWFALGDRDLATHVLRTNMLAQGHSLTTVTSTLCQALGIDVEIIPMSDDRVQTFVQTASGDLEFQHYFVREQCQPRVTGFRFAGIEVARPNPRLLECIENDCSGIVICPSNPYVSIDPILNLPLIRDCLKAAKLPIVAVSPIVAGQAIKGPVAKMMLELGLSVDPISIIRHYEDFLTGFILDERDATLLQTAQKTYNQDIVLLTTDTIMADKDKQRALAEQTLTLLSA